MTLESGLVPMADEVAIQALPCHLPWLPRSAHRRRRRWARLAAAYRTRASLRIVDDLLPNRRERRTVRTARRTEFRNALREAEPTRRRGILADHVTAQVVSAMGLASSQLLDPAAGFFQSGMDSLMSVTLQRSLSDSLGETLSRVGGVRLPDGRGAVGLLGQHSPGGGGSGRGRKYRRLRGLQRRRTPQRAF